MLDLLRPNWREDHVILLDGATPHTASATIELYKTYRVPVVLSSPYSYDSAPCELFFSQFKSVDLNVDRLSTGKK